MWFLLAACAAPPADTGADSAAPSDPLAAYDSDGDGVLEVEDLRDGQVVLLLDLASVRGEAAGPAAWSTTEARIEPVEGASWAVRADFAAGEGPAATDMAFVLRFLNGATLTERSGAAEYVSLAPADRDVLLLADDPGGSVAVSFVGAERASGFLDGAEPELAGVDTATGAANGESLTLRAAVFRTLPVATAAAPPRP